MNISGDSTISKQEVKLSLKFSVFFCFLSGITHEHGIIFPALSERVVMSAPCYQHVISTCSAFSPELSARYQHVISRCSAFSPELSARVVPSAPCYQQV